MAETDPAKRAEIYTELNQQVFDEAPQIILALATGRHYEQRWVRGLLLQPDRSGILLLRTVQEVISYRLLLQGLETAPAISPRIFSCLEVSA